MKRFLSAVLLAASLVIPTAGVFAASPASSTETLSLTVTLTLTGVPATLDYGTIAAGQAATVTATPFSITAGSTSPAWRLNVKGTDLTSGANSIAATTRRLSIASAAGAVAVSPMVFNGTAAAVFPVADTFKDISVTAAAGTATFTTVTPSIIVPAGKASGNYTGSMTFAVTND